ncbi:hypothetical protein [Hyphomonas sp.]|uniref:hypothetical protein n=1 Tax=Hyphomonas sp. TaxID=87 RepID=UPI000C4ECE07|nr:hypothetical protein [Hyphomonas sp.]MAU67154.1 hypothetical protein [Hyphomonas sp.]MBM57457.1 hypothetical protein [Hyphomonas sp.]
MSAIRFIAVSLAAASVALPVLAAEDIGLRGRLEADFLPKAGTAEDAPAVMETVVVTKTDGSDLLVSKPAVLRYDVAPEVPARVVAETRGQDPERTVETR